MKMCQKFLWSVALMATLLIPASAHTHPGDTIVYPIMSSWAQNEVMKAKALNLIPEWLPQDYRVPITREDFRKIALNFIAEQQNCSYRCFCSMVDQVLCDHDANGFTIKVFSDGSAWDTIAYQIGLLQGNGDGTCTPEREITRQEAAVMLTRAYQVYAGELPTTPEVNFLDMQEISDWAQDSVALLSEWNVMTGLEDGSFAPQESYTVEQCIITFLRLYENGPVSRKNGNVTHMFTYDQAMEYAKHPMGLNPSDPFVSDNVEGEKATFIRTNYYMSMSGVTYIHFIYPDASVRELDLGVCNNSEGFHVRQPLDDIHFSEDGETLYCTVVLNEDAYTWVGGKRLLHEQGVYHVAIDVDTRQYQVEKEPDGN